MEPSPLSKVPWEQQRKNRHMCHVPSDVRGTAGGESMREYLNGECG